MRDRKERGRVPQPATAPPTLVRPQRPAARCLACSRPSNEHDASCSASLPLPAEDLGTARAAALGLARVLRDTNSRTCIELRREASGGEKVVVFVRLGDDGVCLGRSGARDFDHSWREVDDYPPARAAKLYAGYARMLGAAPGAMAELARLTNVTEEDTAMAASREQRQKHTATAVPQRPTQKANNVPIARPAKAAPAKAATKDQRRTFASACREMLMEKGADGRCRQTDDQIFAKLKSEFHCADKCRPHVSWYRGQLRRNGKTPPQARK